MTTARQTRPVSLWMAGIYGLLAVAVLALALSLPLLARVYYRPFSVPARSMVPTLLVGDYFFASKVAYADVPGSEPARGDVVVFLLPKDNTTVYVKRVAGLPGDRIQMKEGLLYINDVAVARERVADFVGQDPCGTGGKTGTRRWRETLPNGVSYETLDCVDSGFLDNTIVYKVPADSYFMLGDNRDNSADSRMLSQTGYVPRRNIIGRAAMIFFSYESASLGASAGLRYGRIGMLVR